MERVYLDTVEQNLERLKELVKLETELSSAIVEGRTDDPEYALGRQFELLVEMSGLYHDTALILDRVVSEENAFKANRFYKELCEFKPLVIGE